MLSSPYDFDVISAHDYFLDDGPSRFRAPLAAAASFQRITSRYDILLATAALHAGEVNFAPMSHSAGETLIILPLASR